VDAGIYGAKHVRNNTELATLTNYLEAGG